MRICSIFLSVAFFLFSEKTELLFHLHDAGETFALIPVIQKLTQEYLIIASGTSKELLQEFPQDRFRDIEARFDIEPKKVITGVASELQADTLKFFRSRGIQTLAFWDNLNADGPGPYFSRAHQIEVHADVLLLPCEALSPYFRTRATEIVGHPTLDYRQKPKLAVWIGGYGEEYEEAFSLFKEGMKQVEDMIFLIQHHPKTGLKNDLKTSDAICLADLVICHQSSAAFQALAMNKPVLYVIPESQHFDNLVLQKNLAKKVSRVEDFAEGMTAALECERSAFHELMGIPQNSTETFLKSLWKKSP